VVLGGYRVLYGGMAMVCYGMAI